MKKLITILSAFVLCCCNSSDSSVNNYNLVEFNKFLGDEKAASLNEAVKSFNEFLKLNYNDLLDDNQRTRKFLEDLSQNYSPIDSWIFKTEMNIQTLENLEKSGMRLEIMKYGYEEYESKYFIDNIDIENPQDSIYELEYLILEIEEDLTHTSINASRRLIEMGNKTDSLLWYNKLGQYHVGLTKFGTNSKFVKEYVQAHQEIGNLGVVNVLKALLEENVDYQNPFIKRIIVAELYLDLMKWDVKNKFNDHKLTKPNN